MAETTILAGNQYLEPFLDMKRPMCFWFSASMEFQSLGSLFPFFE